MPTLTRIKRQPLSIAKEARRQRRRRTREPDIRWMDRDERVVAFAGAGLQARGKGVVDRGVVDVGERGLETAGGVGGEVEGFVGVDWVGVADEDVGGVWVAGAEPGGEGVGAVGVERHALETDCVGWKRLGWDC